MRNTLMLTSTYSVMQMSAKCVTCGIEHHLSHLTYCWQDECYSLLCKTCYIVCKVCKEKICIDHTRIRNWCDFYCDDCCPEEKVQYR